MFTGPRLTALALLACLSAAPGFARLGDTLADLKKIYGRPELHPRPDVSYWLINGNNGDMLYTATFNPAGHSISESLKPVKQARFTPDIPEGFIKLQLQRFEGSKTRRTVAPGETYTFAGQNFVCAKFESIIVDEPNGILLIWNKSVYPSVMAVSPEVFQGGK